MRLLAELGASAWLVRHHELVVEAAELLCDRVAAVDVSFDRELVLAGAALHDAGKIVVPEEMREAGHRHEAEGERLLTERGVAPGVARFCVTHAAWDADDLRLEDLLVALADKLWKGARVEALERRIAARIEAGSGLPSWKVFDELDRICEAIARGGPERLVRSDV